MKGKSTIGELMSLPNRIFHTLYHNHYLAEEDRIRREKIEKMNNKDAPVPTRKDLENMKDELEDIGWEGLV